MPARRATKQQRGTVALDTSCVVPLLCTWHDHHSRTVGALESVVDRAVVICSHVLLESFSVLTRLPPPYRLTVVGARQLLEANFGDPELVGQVDREDCWSAIGSATEAGSGGGRVYDAVIAHASARAGASVLFTWNVKHFLSVAPAGLEVRTPSPPPR